MDPRVVPLAGILDLNTRLFRNCLADLSEAQSRVRPSAVTNHAAFVAAHLTDSRYYLLKMLGVTLPCPLEKYLGQWRGINEITAWPTLEETRSAWDGASTALAQRLERITAAELDGALDTQMPTYAKTTLGMLTFLVGHDSHHIGQLALLRKYAGLPEMAYT